MANETTETNVTRPMVTITIMFQPDDDHPGPSVMEKIRDAVRDVPEVLYDFRETTMSPSQLMRGRTGGLLRQSS